MAREAIEAYLEVMREDGLPGADRPAWPGRGPRRLSPKLPALSGAELIAVLESQGWYVARVKGSHQ